MKKNIILTLVIILGLAVCASAANWRMPLDGTGKFVQQGYGPQSNLPKKSTAVYKAKGSFVNITTAGHAAVKCSIRTPASNTAAGTATAARVRFGGYTTGGETAHYPTSEDVFWNPPAKIGFKNYSGILDVHCSEQP
jgi:hypothetical protein